MFFTKTNVRHGLTSLHDTFSQKNAVDSTLKERGRIDYAACPEKSDPFGTGKRASAARQLSTPKIPLNRLFKGVAVFGLAISLTTMVGGCASEIEDMPQNPEKEPVLISSALTLEEALERATPYLDAFGEKETRGESRTIKSSTMLHILSDEETRSENLPTDVYVVNFEDESGFAILGADTRMEPIYGYSDEGSIEITPDGTGVDNFYINDILPGIIRAENNQSNIDQSSPTGTNGSGDIGIGGGTILPPPLIVKNVVVSPMVPNPISKNWITDLQYEYDGKNYYLDNASVVISQIMSIFAYPKSFNNLNIDWRPLRKGNSADQSKVFHIAQHLARPASSSNWFPKDIIIETLSNLGYNTPNQEYFGTLKVCNILKSGEPVIVIGVHNVTSGMRTNSMKRILPNHQIYYSYYWLIDGYFSGYKQAGTTINENPKKYFHCVWGKMQGDKPISSNGYFYFKDDRYDSGSDREDEFHDVSYSDNEFDEGCSWGEYSGGLQSPNDRDGEMFNNIYILRNIKPAN